jgi:hypothetical protein
MIKNAEEVKKRNGVFFGQNISIINPDRIGPNYDADFHIIFIKI